MNPMIEIGRTLGELYRKRAELSVETWKIEKDIQERKLELTPAEGWQGKNAEARDIESQKVFGADENMRAFVSALADAEAEKAQLAAYIDGMEAERRALEWQVRCGLVEALTGKAIQFETPGENVEYSAFDDVLLDEADEMFISLSDDWGDLPSPDPDETPAIPEPEFPLAVGLEEDLPF